MMGRRQPEGLLGWAALLAPIPLPFNSVLEWAVLVLYLGLVALFLVSSRDRTLPTWAMNVLGVAYLPVLLVDLRLILGRGQLVQTVVHLCMFAVVVKLFALRSRRDLWQTFGAVFFLFLASMGTSVHPSVVVYLLLFSALAMGFLMRMAMTRVLVRFGGVEETLAKVPIGGFLAAATGVALLASAPLFALFPRLNAPFVGLRGSGTGTEIFATGFSDEVSLDAIGQQRGNPEVALRLRYEEDPPDPAEIRLKGGTFEIFQGKRWSASQRRATILTSQDGIFQLDQKPVVQRVDLWLQPIGSKALLLPVEAVDVETLLPLPVLTWDRGGAVSLWQRPKAVLPYRVGLADGPVLTGVAPGAEKAGPAEPSLSTEGVSDRIRELAEEVMGEGRAAVRADRLMGFFETEFTFSLAFMGRTGPAPLDEFLFQGRAGHCELFASSAVLMLRSQGIPARLVTGFLGADYNPLTGYFVVRQGNAHAWVEAYFEESGWTLLDPTPPAGRPTAPGLREGWSVFRQAWDYVQFRWERYVLTYGFQDQASALWGLRKVWLRLQAWLAGRSSGSSGDGEVLQDPGPGVQEEIAALGEVVEGEEGFQIPPAAVPLVVALILASWLWRKQRRDGLTAQRAFRALRRSWARAGLEISPATAPGDLERRAAESFPQAREPSAKVIDFYLRESFGGRELSPEERRELGETLREAKKSIRRRAAG